MSIAPRLGIRKKKPDTKYTLRDSFMKDTFRNRLRKCIYHLHENKQDMNLLAWWPSIVHIREEPF